MASNSVMVINKGLFGYAKPLSHKGMKNTELSDKGLAHLREFGATRSDTEYQYFDNQTFLVEVCRVVEANKPIWQVFDIMLGDTTVTEDLKMMKALRLDREEILTKKKY